MGGIGGRIPKYGNSQPWCTARAPSHGSDLSLDLQSESGVHLTIDSSAAESDQVTLCSPCNRRLRSRGEAAAAGVRQFSTPRFPTVSGPKLQAALETTFNPKVSGCQAPGLCCLTSEGRAGLACPYQARHAHSSPAAAPGRKRYHLQAPEQRSPSCPARFRLRPSCHQADV